MKRQTSCAAAAAAALALAVAATAASASDLYWQGTDGSVDSPNYFNANTSTAGVGPTSADALYIGAGSTLTQVSNLTAGRLILGHAGTSTAGAAGASPGAGTVNITGGSFATTGTIVNTTPPAGLTSNPEASMIIGYAANGAFSITNASVTASDTVIVGFSLTDATINASLAINNGGSLTLTKGGLQLGGNGTSTVAGAGGTATVNGGTLSIGEAGADLVIGVWNKSTFVQTGGITTVADETFVGRRNADFSSFTLSGGMFATRQFHVADTSGNGRIDDVSASITDATLTSTSTVDIGAGNSRRASLTIGHGANVTGGAAFNVAGGDAVDTTVTIGSTANVSFTGNLVVGGGAGANRTNVTITDSATFKAASVNIGNGANTTGTGSNNSTLTISGSAVANTGAIAVGSATGAANSSLVVSGDAKLTGSVGLNIGSGATSTTNSSVTFKDNALINLTNGMTVGLTADTNAVLNINDNATVNLVTGGGTGFHFFVGRGSSTATFNMTGGSITSPNYVLFGTATSAAASITANHSGGTVNAGTSATSPNRGFKLGDTNGTTTYNLSGTGAINVANGLMIVGRQNATATMIQTGGSVTASGGLHIGDAETTTAASMTGVGVYNVSAGSINASVPVGSTVDALSIAPTGTGTLRVIGDDATINVTGNMLVNTTAAADPNPARVGTLAYQLEAGDSLSMISVTGTATFSLNSVLSLDLNSVTPTQTSYDLVTALDVIDNGISFSAPAGWNYRIVAGGNGEILQAFTTPVHFPGDTNNDGVVDLTDLNNVLNNFGSTGPNPGDDNSDGTVDLTDLNNVLNNFGSTHAASALASVPEPASLGLIGLAAAGLIGRRRRR